MKIKLNENEMIMAADVGVRRNAASVSRNHKQKHGSDPTKNWQTHIEGACGEVAFSKAIGWYWNGSVNTFKHPDIRGIDIRTRSKSNYDLIIRPDDKGIFVLVIGNAPNYNILGWMKRDDVKDEWKQDHGNRPTAWFVPQNALYPIETLEEVVKDKRSYNPGDIMIFMYSFVE